MLDIQAILDVFVFKGNFLTKKSKEGSKFTCLTI